ncbi:VWA domain-containing protein [Klebsiella michiganensis]|uniref:VWA domain-containing protein n=1 Tax=Klebsiella michiganensis TaxID=1134687 RepID=UPI002FF21E71
MSDFHFLHPWFLVLLPLCLALWWLPSAGRSAWVRMMDKPLARALIVNQPRKITRVLPWMMMTGIIGLAGPAWQRQLPAALTPQSNVMVVLQQDNAMLASDLAPDRHQRMQSKILSLMAQMPGTRFGLVVYQSGAWLTTPLTVDQDFYALFLHAQSPALLPAGEGSGLQAALALAMKNMPSPPRSIILVADNIDERDARWLIKQSLPLQIWVPGTARGGTLPEKYASRGTDTRLNVARFEQIRDGGIPVTLVTSDDSDFSAIRSHIQQSVSAQNNARIDLHWRNSGWLAVIPILIIVLLWRRQLFCWLLIAPLLMWQPAGHAASWLDAWVSPDIQGQQAQGNRAKIAAIIMQLRQKERDRLSAQGEEQDDKPDEIKHDLKPEEGVEQKDIQPQAGGNPQVNQWYENLSVSPSGLLENLYRTQSGEQQ